MEVNPIILSLKDISERTEVLRGYLQYAEKLERLEEVSRELEDPAVWNEPERAQALGKERASLDNVVTTIDDLARGVVDARDLLDMAVEEDDADTVDEVRAEVANLDELLNQLEFRRMFSGEADANNAFLDIQAGSGGTEAQDWAEMMLRMYLRWGEDKGFKVELLECSAGDVAGIQSATIRRAPSGA